MLVKSKGLSVFVSASVMGALLLTGCGSKSATTPSAATTSAASTSTAVVSASPAAAQAKAIKHIWGETPIQGVPTKPIALDFFIVDMLVSLGISPTGIAGTGATRVPAYIKDKVTSFTDVGERKAPNLEVISSVKPDLIIANPERAKMIKGDLEKIAPSIALSDKTYQVILDDVDLLGGIFNKQEQAKKVRADLEKKISDAKGKVKNQPTVLVVGAFDDEMTVWVKKSFPSSLLNDIGFNYAFAGEKEKSEGTADIATMTVEKLVELNPDVVFIYGDSVDKVKTNPLFKNSKASKENHVFVVEQDLWARARGPIAAGLMIDQAVNFVNGEAKK
ncbi:iron-siderophore ABC transporter substrate-binding protein [Paenibacillus sp. SYP-B3998]|uniref:Iron-siderophore ABC transporter substrate-binding protein n=1 Tax=Paenibacillus sp. SYP-B3998 TaxID=2678564 RepID=A0A6G3ZS22_9BACL|nr:iron-siderophore ABC transporter substrate-binding protein [Paenibacillus sp. SYP-B3998]NEW05003.1 iron-siderophore ABC transporter substrate-binding protein [Paenibacillus sp. SYP-B3998]